MFFCSNVEFKSKEVPCFANSNYELKKEIVLRRFGAIYMGKAIIENQDVAIKITIDRN